MLHAYALLLTVLLLLIPGPSTRQTTSFVDPLYRYELEILGIAQDAGYPQIGCTKVCCEAVKLGREPKQKVTSLAVKDTRTGNYWLWEASPDMPAQLDKLQTGTGKEPFKLPTGILLTHGHVGHYTGLMHLGREAYGSKGIDVFAMPRMEAFLKNNGPWSQLVALNNIRLKPLQSDRTISLAEGLAVTPIPVPHRDEYTETVGYLISGQRKILFIPDIDKWEKWERDIASLIKTVDIALVDGTFFDSNELPGRDMREIPHPLVTETMSLLKALPDSLRKKVTFIHFNHTNPLIQSNSPQERAVISAGFSIAREGMRFSL